MALIFLGFFHGAGGERPQQGGQVLCISPTPCCFLVPTSSFGIGPDRKEGRERGSKGLLISSCGSVAEAASVELEFVCLGVK